MILIATNRGDYTADFLILKFQERDIDYLRFNTEDFPFSTPASLTPEGGTVILEKAGKRFDLSEVTGVWYRRPEGPSFPADFDPQMHDFVNRECREFLQGIWRSINCSFVNHPDKIRLAENKIEQLGRMNKMGFQIPDTLVTNDPKAAMKFYDSHGGEIIAKTLRASHGQMGKQEYVIYTNSVSKEHLSLIDSVRLSPVIFQEKVKKMSDIRVTVVDHHVFSTEIFSQNSPSTEIDWRRDTLSLKHVPHSLPHQIERACINLVQAYGLVFGTLDLIRRESGDYVFLELNPNGQWAWIESLTGQPISDKLIEVLTRG